MCIQEQTTTTCASCGFGTTIPTSFTPCDSATPHIDDSENSPGKNNKRQRPKAKKPCRVVTSVVFTESFTCDGCAWAVDDRRRRELWRDARGEEGVIAWLDGQDAGGWEQSPRDLGLYSFRGREEEREDVMMEGRRGDVMAEDEGTESWQLVEGREGGTREDAGSRMYGEEVMRAGMDGDEEWLVVSESWLSIENKSDDTGLRVSSLSLKGRQIFAG